MVLFILLQFCGKIGDTGKLENENNFEDEENFEIDYGEAKGSWVED